MEQIENNREYGRFDSSKEFKQTRICKVYNLAILFFCIFGLFSLGCGILFMGYKDNTIRYWGIYVGVLSFGGALICVSNKFKAKKVFEEGKEKLFEESINVQTKYSQIYHATLEKGVTSLEDESSLSILYAVADMFSVPREHAKEYYEKGKAIAEKKEQEKTEQEHDAQRKKEKEEYNGLIRYSELKGRDKRVVMLSEELAKLTNRKSTFDMLQDAIGYTQQKEQDWAVHGGIAAGIAGTAAGVATAASIQQKNAQIRASNAANTQFYNEKLGMAALDADIRRDKEIERLNAMLSEAKTKLVVENSEDSAFARLAFVDTDVDISETGAFSVSSAIMCNHAFNVFEKLVGCVDGTIAADLFQDNQCVGTALLVLNKMGAPFSKYNSRIKGMCLTGAKKGVPYKVVFRPYHLWEMEQ